MKKIIVLILIALAGASILFFIIKNTNKPEPTKKTTKPKAHFLPKDLKNKIIADVKKDLEIIQQVTDNPGRLKEAMAGTALLRLTSQINKKKSQSVVVVRNFDNIDIKIVNYVKKTISITLEFIDRSYEYDIKTKRFVSQPTNKKNKLALLVEEKNKRWKITGIFQPKPIKRKSNKR